MKKLFATVLATGLILTELLNPLTTYATEVTPEDVVSEVVTDETNVTEGVTEDESVTEEATEAVANVAENDAAEEKETAEFTTKEDSLQSADEKSTVDGNAEESVESDSETTEKTTEKAAEEVTEPSAEETEIEYIKDEGSLSYVVVLNPELNQNVEQKILLGLSNASTFENPVLTVENKTSKTYYELKNYSLEVEGLTFTDSFRDNGQYGLVSLKYEKTVDGEKTYYEINFNDLGIEAGFGVEVESQFEADAVVEDKDAETMSPEEAEFVVTDMTGDSSSIKDVTEALENAEEEVSGVPTAKVELSDKLKKLTGTITANAASNVVVVLDPGHGCWDSGAINSRLGLKEKDLTLAIANYCKAELETYPGIKVYMTRTSDNQPGITYDGKTVGSTTESLHRRIAFAKSKKAKYFISIHINSIASASVSGATVYYPNGNYNAKKAANGKAVAAQIQKQLVALGLKNNGIRIRNSEDGSRYPDGSLRDYYGVIGGAMEAGFPGIIVEHAYISNDSDCVNYLNSPAKLKRLGVADATGIANHLGLKKTIKLGKTKIKSAKAVGFNEVHLTWKKLKKVSGYYVYRRTEKGDWKNIGRTDKRSFVDTTGKTNTKYYYAVAGYISAGVGEKCEAVSVVTNNGQVTTIAAANATFNANMVSWGAVPGAGGYMVYRREGKSGSFSVLTPLGTPQTSFEDNTAKCGKTYQYRVRAFRMVSGKAIYGKYSSKKTITSSNGQVVITEKLKNGLHCAGVTWAPMNGVTGYRVSRKAPNDKKWKVVKKSTAKLTYRDDAVSAGKTYKYKVQAYRVVDGKTYWGTAKTAKVTAGKGDTKLIGVTRGEFNALVVTWQPVPGAGKYIVQRREITSSGKTEWKNITEKAKGQSYADVKAGCGKTYQYRVRATRKYKNKVRNGKFSAASVNSTASMGIVSVSKASLVDTGIQVAWTPIAGVSGYQVYRKAEGECKYSSIGTSATASYVDRSFVPGVKYSYVVKAYRTVGKKNYYSASKSDVLTEVAPYTILGESNVTIQQMVAYYNASGKAYPEFYKYCGTNGEFATVTGFCRVVYNTSKKYGVRPEVAWAMICKDTNYLQFGGTVIYEDFNFGNLGCTGDLDIHGQPTKYSFASVQDGITAQVQHLKMYAQADSSWWTNLNASERKDQGFDTSKAGKAPYVEWLGVSSNPYGVGWTTKGNYSESLLEKIWSMRNL